MWAYIAANWQVLLLYGGLLVLAFVAALLVRRLLSRLLYRFVEFKTDLINKKEFYQSLRPGTILLFFFFASLISITPAMPSDFPEVIIQRLMFCALILAVGWQLASLVSLGSDFIIRRHTTKEPDNLLARKINTQVVVLRRLLHAGVIIITLAFMLMVFPPIRNVGAGLFASAGIIGIMAGMAARPTLGNLVAGLQIAFAQPIRIDDVVIVENEWGWIEEIRSTYVVVRIWDLRRMVLPISYFIEKPFQNWTRQTADLLGTVFLYTDYTVPVQAVREHLFKVLDGTPLWDKKVWNLQVTDSTDKTMELRALMSAPNSSQAWDLRCYVREQMVAFLQEHYPQSLPKIRASLEPQSQQNRTNQASPSAP